MSKDFYLWKNLKEEDYPFKEMLQSSTVTYPNEDNIELYFMLQVYGVNKASWWWEE